MELNLLPSFLPSSAKLLTEPLSVALLRQMQRCAVTTPLSKDAIATAFVHTEAPGWQGCPLVLLPGFDSSLLEFRFLFPLLADQQETWLVDLLGWGFTDHQSHIAVTPKAIKTHLYCFWQQQIHRPMILVGASLGGAVAIDFTLTYPELVDQLVLIDSTGYTGPPPLVQYLASPLDYWAVEYLRLRKLMALELALWLRAEPHWLDLLRCALLHTEMPGWHQAVMSFTRSGGYQLADRIAKITQPTLILWGESDNVLGTADGDRFHRDIADSQLIWLRNCSHTPHIEQPQATADQIQSFCLRD